MRPWRCMVSRCSSSSRPRSMPSYMRTRSAAESAGTVASVLPFSSRICCSPVARASSASEKASTLSAWLWPERTLLAMLVRLEEEQPRCLQRGLDLGHEPGRAVAVDHTVIHREREIHHLADHDLVVNHRGSLGDLVHRQYGHLGVVDDGRGRKATQRAQAGDGEGGASEIRR